MAVVVVLATFKFRPTTQPDNTVLSLTGRESGCDIRTIQELL
jgi:hypothetical protein